MFSLNRHSPWGSTVYDEKRSKLQDLIHVRLLRDESRNADIRNIANHILDVLFLRNRVDRKLLFTIHHCTAIVYNIFAAMILY